MLLDEIGYFVHAGRAADLFFEVISQRYGEKSTVMTTSRDRMAVVLGMSRHEVGRGGPGRATVSGQLLPATRAITYCSFGRAGASLGADVGGTEAFALVGSTHGVAGNAG